MKKLLLVLLLFISLLCSEVVISTETGKGVSDEIKFDYYGFLTQGAIKTRKNDYFGESAGNDISFDFREIGIGGTLGVRDRLSLSALVLSRNAGETDEGEARIDHAFISWLQPVKNYGDIILLAGRIKIPLGFFNETRDVASTRPSILLPQSVYYDNARKYLINSDGAYINWLGQLYSTDWQFKLVAGLATTPGINNVETEAYYLGASFPGELESERAQQLAVWFDNNMLGTSLVFQYAGSISNYVQGASDPLPQGYIRTRTFIVGIRQNWNNFSVTAELLRNKTHYEDFAPVIPEISVYPQGNYFQFSYTPTNRLETFIRYDVLYIDEDDKQGKKQSALTGRPPQDFFAKDTTIGTRYHFSPKLNISIEYHNIDGTGWLPLADNPNPQTHKRFWDMGLVQFSYTF